MAWSRLPSSGSGFVDDGPPGARREVPSTETIANGFYLTLIYGSVYLSASTVSI